MYSGNNDIVGFDPGFIVAPVFESGKLVNADEIDLRLREGGAAVNAGTNDVVDTETDLAGNPRIVDGIVDIGAYEFVASAELDAPVLLTGTGSYYVSCGANRHRIAWSAVENASIYELSYSVNGGETWHSIETAETSAVVSGLDYGADVIYQVRAFGAGGSECSEWSEAKSFCVCPMDINGDGDISGSDRALLASVWLSEEGDEEFLACADIDGDGDVSNRDRTFLSENWLGETGDDDLHYPGARAADAALAEFASADPDFGLDLF